MAFDCFDVRLGGKGSPFCRGRLALHQPPEKLLVLEAGISKVTEAWFNQC